jgi:inhibitor of cysteine peptidase
MSLQVVIPTGLRILIAAVALISLAATSCGDDARERLTMEDNGSSIEISVGDTFDVVLEGNPTTGFGWIVESGDSAIVEVTGEPEFEPESDLVGAPGEFTFVFEGMSPGTTTLEFAYRRSFETAPPQSTFTLTVTVE